MKSKGLRFPVTHMFRSQYGWDINLDNDIHLLDKSSNNLSYTH